MQRVATWWCPLCGAAVPVVYSARQTAGVLSVTVRPTALADVYVHVWAEHPEVTEDARP